MSDTRYNRLIALIGYMGLTAWVAYLMSKGSVFFTKDVAMLMLGATGTPILTYIGIKGKSGAGIDKEGK